MKIYLKSRTKFKDYQDQGNIPPAHLKSKFEQVAFFDKQNMSACISKVENYLCLQLRKIPTLRKDYLGVGIFIHLYIYTDENVTHEQIIQLFNLSINQQVQHQICDYLEKCLATDESLDALQLNLQHKNNHFEQIQSSIIHIINQHQYDLDMESNFHTLTIHQKNINLDNLSEHWQSLFLSKSKQVLKNLPSLQINVPKMKALDKLAQKIEVFKSKMIKNEYMKEIIFHLHVDSNHKSNPEHPILFCANLEFHLMIQDDLVSHIPDQGEDPIFICILPTQLSFKLKK